MIDDWLDDDWSQGSTSNTNIEHREGKDTIHDTYVRRYPSGGATHVSFYYPTPLRECSSRQISVEHAGLVILELPQAGKTATNSKMIGMIFNIQYQS